MGLTIEQIEIIISELRSCVRYYMDSDWNAFGDSCSFYVGELYEIIKILEEFRKEG